jgi:capsular polysaccharide biosynthesis protein
VLNGEPWLHESAYRKMSGMEAMRTDNALVDRLWVIDDHGINENRIARIKELRKSIQAAAPRAGTKRLVLTRGTLGAARNLVNSNEVHEALEKKGFEIVNPEHETVDRIVNALSSAEIAILVEGSVQNHCICAMPVGSTLLTIQPPTRFNAVSKDRADAVGMHWSFVVADPHQDGFYLPIDHLMRTLDEVSRMTGRGALA